MCGIVGIIGKREVTPLLIEGLKRLEYRGYDSAGVATLVNGHIKRRRAQGKVSRLEEKLVERPLSGTVGIAHTRWATHGVPNEVNAHPHATDRVAIIHNGIIENFQEIKKDLLAKGHAFESQTDSEIVAHLVTDYLNQQMRPKEAVAAALKRLHGAFALALMFAGEHDLLIGARRGPPLAVGYGDDEMYLGSDALALASLTRKICYLEDGDYVVVSGKGAEIYNADDKPVTRKIVETAASGALVGKGEFKHFMLKEIYEQPAVIGDSLASYLNPATNAIMLPQLPIDLAAVPRFTITACGTAYYAGFVAKYWLEQIARVPVELDVASELRYRNAPLPPGGAMIVVSQSGETADTLAALRYAKEHGQKVIAVVNVPESSIAREADAVLPTRAGPEIGVASTKAFTTQLTVLAALAIATARARGTIDKAREARLSHAIAEVPARAAEVLAHDKQLKLIAHVVSQARDVLYLGRGPSYPIALEGALKLKEISYIHAEGYAAGEMKHGPIALIDEQVPIIVIAPSDDLFDKTASNTQETVARGGKVIFLSDKAGIERLGDIALTSVELPHVDPFVAPILYAIPVQLLAYHTAVIKGTDVDKPRNLAKSVTVE